MNLVPQPGSNGGAYRDTQFIDSYDGHERVETFITHDLLRYIDTHYRTVPTGRARGLAGYSAGAYGALNIGFHHPTCSPRWQASAATTVLTRAK